MNRGRTSTIANTLVHFDCDCVAERTRRNVLIVSIPRSSAPQHFLTILRCRYTFFSVSAVMFRTILKTEIAKLDAQVEADNMLLDWQPNEEQYDRPFTTAFNKLMNEICVSRKGNRGHSLVGNDVHTMLQPENQERLCALLEPRQVHPRNEKKYGNPEAAAKLRTLLGLVGDMYRIATAARGLSDDEISGLQSLGNELAEWYPKNYPERTITPKFHVATHHIPEFAAKYRTVGLVSEHCLESTHAEFKKYDQRFACDGNGEIALRASLHQNMLEHDARLGSFSLKRRECEDCGREIRQLGKRIRTEPDIIRCACKTQSQEE